MVEERTRQLRGAQEQLIKSERLAAVGEVAAMVGHDLRNPLTGISVAAYYLKKKTGPQMDEKAREMLEIIRTNIRHSDKIINDLLEYSGEIRLELTKVSPKALMRIIMSSIKVPSNIRILDATIDDLEMRLDVEKMKRVFVNIIENAIDAMPNGGTLKIANTQKDGNLQIILSDTGIGMPECVLKKVWTPFFTTKAKGMGLGLPICKRIVEAHEGRIHADSTIGKGTTFTVTLPLNLRTKKEEGGEKTCVRQSESLLSTTMKA
jgi:signal transduction histidine kinase